MKKILLYFMLLSSISNIAIGQKILDGNDVKAYFLPSGIFNQDPTLTLIPGLEWPKNNSAHAKAVMSSGLNIAAKINGQLLMCASSYKGEYTPGYCNNSVVTSSSAFRVYKVQRGDNAGNNPDYAEWGNMVPYGAPYVDVNSNGIFEPGIDTPGVHNAIQTIFVCLTDGLPITHNSSEGFGGGTLPLFAEVHMTAWCYEDSALINAQFIKWDIINRSGLTWEETHLSIFFDGDLGQNNDDWTGCDTTQNLGYTYNSDNDDGGGSNGTYGSLPPAVGFCLLKTPKKNSTDEYGLTSYGLYNISSSTPCETSTTIPEEALNYMKGFKKDGTPWVNRETMLTTKYCFPGDPESDNGWTESDGRMLNCGGDTTGIITPGVAGNRKSILNTGGLTLNIQNNTSVQIVASQFVSRAAGHLKSVTKLKSDASLIRNYWQTIGISTISSEIPESFRLHQNYPNPFNPSTNIRFEIPKNMGIVRLKVYDINGKEVATLVNQELETGIYEYEFDGSNLASGIYFYKIETTNLSETRKMVLVK